VSNTVLSRFEITFILNDFIEALAVEPIPSWFRLSDGAFDVHCSTTSIYGAVRDGVHYYVARPWEDLIAVEPFALEPIPHRLVELVSSPERWASTVEEIMDRSPGETRTGGALGWWTNRIVDSSYLVGGPELAFVRVGSEIRIFGTTAGHAACVATVGADQFAEEMSLFDRRLIEAMATRLDELTTRRLVDAPTLEELRADHDRRAALRAYTLARHLPTDWASVLRALEQLHVV
jgi:hypothetical protein